MSRLGKIEMKWNGRRMLKWLVFVLLVSLVFLRVIAGIIMQRRYDARLEAYRNQGDPLTLAEAASPEVPPERNAAVLYERAFAMEARLPEHVRKRLGRLPSAERWPETLKELEEARALLAQATEILRLLRDGSQRPACRFDVNYKAPSTMLNQQHLGNVQGAVRWVRLSARVKLTEGKGDAALADCQLILKLAEALQGEPLVMSMLVEAAVTEMGLRETALVLDRYDPRPEMLRQMTARLGQVEDRSRFTQAIRGERCVWLQLLAYWLKAKTPPTHANPSGESIGLVERAGHLLFKPVIIGEMLTDLDFLEKSVELGQHPLYEVEAEWAGLQQEMVKAAGGSGGGPVLSGNLVPALRVAAESFDAHVARKACAKQAIALRLYRMKHGQYPEHLAALVPDFLDKLPTDPFSGKGFVYRKEGEGFIIYSVGVNGTDDGGTEDPESRELDDIVWKCSR